MAHNLEYVSDTALSALTIRGRATGGSDSRSRSAAATVYARFTKLGGGFMGKDGLRIKVRSAADDTGLGPVDIRGEDLYALREFLAELPEEAFVRPADPVEKPERWTDGDIVEEFYGPAQSVRRIWSREGGRWSYPGRRTMPVGPEDVNLESGLTPGHPWRIEIIRQASGQDL